MLMYCFLGVPAGSFIPVSLKYDLCTHISLKLKPMSVWCSFYRRFEGFEEPGPQKFYKNAMSKGLGCGHPLGCTLAYILYPYPHTRHHLSSTVLWMSIPLALSDTSTHTDMRLDLQPWSGFVWRWGRLDVLVWWKQNSGWCHYNDPSRVNLCMHSGQPWHISD